MDANTFKDYIKQNFKEITDEPSCCNLHIRSFWYSGKIVDVAFFNKEHPIHGPNWQDFPVSIDEWDGYEMELTSDENQLVEIVKKIYPNCMIYVICEE